MFNKESPHCPGRGCPRLAGARKPPDSPQKNDMRPGRGMRTCPSFLSPPIDARNIARIYQHMLAR
jgi:hypothetical protein